MRIFTHPFFTALSVLFFITDQFVAQVPNWLEVYRADTEAYTLGYAYDDSGRVKNNGTPCASYGMCAFMHGTAGKYVTQTFINL